MQTDDAKADEIVGYNYIIDQINKEVLDEFNDEGTSIFHVIRIASHQGPLRPGDTAYKGSTWNVLVEWETGETTYESLTELAKDSPV